MSDMRVFEPQIRALLGTPIMDGIPPQLQDPYSPGMDKTLMSIFIVTQFLYMRILLLLRPKQDAAGGNVEHQQPLSLALARRARNLLFMSLAPLSISRPPLSLSLSLSACPILVHPTQDAAGGNVIHQRPLAGLCPFHSQGLGCKGLGLKV